MSTTVHERRQVEMSHGLTYYLEAGSGPPLVLLHGASFAAGAESWLVNLPALARHFHVVAPDCLGWGSGDQLAQGYSFGYLVDFLRELQDALALGRTHVVGHSMGGWLAALLAYESPDRVDHLVLVAGGGLAVRPLASMTSWQPPTETELHAALSWLAKNDVDVDRIVAEKLRLLGDPRRVEGFRRVMDHMTDPETRRRYHLTRRLPHVKSPTLVLWGDDDQVNDVTLGQMAQQLIPDAVLQVFQGVGHHLPQEAPAEFERAVVEFCAG